MEQQQDTTIHILWFYKNNNHSLVTKCHKEFETDCVLLGTPFESDCLTCKKNKDILWEPR